MNLEPPPEGDRSVEEGRTVGGGREPGDGCGDSSTCFRSSRLVPRYSLKAMNRHVWTGLETVERSGGDRGRHVFCQAGLQALPFAPARTVAEVPARLRDP
jgi:hypothetical protein